MHSFDIYGAHRFKTSTNIPLLDPIKKYPQIQFDLSLHEPKFCHERSSNKSETVTRSIQTMKREVSCQTNRISSLSSKALNKDQLTFQRAVNGMQDFKLNSNFPFGSERQLELFERFRSKELIKLQLEAIPMTDVTKRKTFLEELEKLQQTFTETDSRRRILKATESFEADLENRMRSLKQRNKERIAKHNEESKEHELKLLSKIESKHSRIAKNFSLSGFIEESKHVSSEISPALEESRVTDVDSHASEDLVDLVGDILDRKIAVLESKADQHLSKLPKIDEFKNKKQDSQWQYLNSFKP